MLVSVLIVYSGVSSSEKITREKRHAVFANAAAHRIIVKTALLQEAYGSRSLGQWQSAKERRRGESIANIVSGW